MADAEPQQLSLEPPREKHKLRMVRMIVVLALLSAAAQGVAGWKGAGFVGAWVGPGVGGMLTGAVAGFVLTLLGFGLLFVALSWAGGDRARFYFVVFALLVLFLLPTFWTNGWNGVSHRILRTIPIFALLGGLAWSIAIAAKKAAPRDDSGTT